MIGPVDGHLRALPGSGGRSVAHLADGHADSGGRCDDQLRYLIPVADAVNGHPSPGPATSGPERPGGKIGLVNDIAVGSRTGQVWPFEADASAPVLWRDGPRFVWPFPTPAVRNLLGMEQWQASDFREAAEGGRIEAGGLQACAVERRAVPTTPHLPAQAMILEEPSALGRERLELLIPIQSAHPHAPMLCRPGEKCRVRHAEAANLPPAV